MVETGLGERTAEFRDVNQRRQASFEVTARIYLSWYDPNGAVSMMRNAANLKPGTALMWIHGDDDEINVLQGRAYAFDRAPPHPKSAYEVVVGGHAATPIRAEGEIIAWLKGL